MAYHLERAIDDFQLLGNVLAEGLELPSALCAGLLPGFKHALFAHQVFGK
jgi:hypothetical protein